MDRRGWNLALGFQEIFTAVVRLRYNRQAVQDAEAFRAQMRQALRVAEQEARSRGCSPEDVKQVIFGVVAFLDESVLSSGRGCLCSRNCLGINWRGKFSFRNCRRR
jgi:type VI secretion system protein ImpK